MTVQTGFNGFPRETSEFFAELIMNNSKAWFDEHRQDYEEHIMTPARAFIVHMGARLRTISPGIIADPRVNKSLFRINRDTRFSKDKSPYKSHLGLWFWEGEGARMECSGYYFHLKPPLLMLAAGMHEFPKNILDAYRESVVHPKHGPALAEAIKQVKTQGFLVGGKHYKKTPRGYDANHENADLLLYNGLYVAEETPIPPELHSPACLDYCFSRYEQMQPVHTWLLEMTRRAGL